MEKSLTPAALATLSGIRARADGDPREAPAALETRVGQIELTEPLRRGWLRGWDLLAWAQDG